MAAYRIESIAGLARQMGFAPSQTRADQVESAEALLHELEPNKAYPLEFIVFRLTGYRPARHAPSAARGPGEELLTGLALQHDLGLLIEQVSDSLDIPSASFGEPVLTIDDVTERFNVTSKTIQRWRRKGLPARRFIFPDGKRRVGFLVRSIERFVQLHSDEVSQATNFSQLTDLEQEEILRRARRLALQCGCCVSEITRRIAKKMGRSHLTILHTIRKHDAENPVDAIFVRAPEPLGVEDRQRVVKNFRRGVPLGVLARRVCRRRSAIYRVIVEERVEKLTKRKQKFIDDPLYHQADAYEMIIGLVRAEELAAPRAGDDRVPRDLPAYFQALYRTPLLTPGRERAMFLKFNYHKFNFVTARRELDSANVRGRDITRLEKHLKLATHTKNAIVAANLRLVVSVARKHLRPSMDLMELVSEGNVTLMRAVESFDFHKGNKFSTYATLALMKGYARSVPMMVAARRKAGAGEEMLVTVADRASCLTTRLTHRDELQSLLQALDPSERAVLLAQYGADAEATSHGVNPEQLRVALSLSRQRARQIHQRAMEKLRDAAGIAQS